MPTTGETIRWAQTDLLKITLPTYVYDRDWERAKSYYLAKLERLRRRHLELSKQVEELERRVSLTKAKVVELENA